MPCLIMIWMRFVIKFYFVGCIGDFILHICNQKWELENDLDGLEQTQQSDEKWLFSHFIRVRGDFIEEIEWSKVQTS